jgi:hypothetical protein
MKRHLIAAVAATLGLAYAASALADEPRVGSNADRVL